MVQVLQYVPTPLEQLTPYISQAAGQIGQGIQQRSALKALMALEKGMEPKDQSATAAQQSPESPGISSIQLAGSVYPIAEKALGKEGAKLYVQGKMKEQELAHQDRAQAARLSERRMEKAEPKLLEKEEKLGHYEQEAARFERLQELFSPELEKKFPSAFTVGLFTKEAELRPTAAANLSPEAQESVKLIADNLSGAKDTFGARVTNFDLQSYMKRLPSLLNSAEGRRRVLRDIRLMNKLNTNHEKGVLDIVEREGGPGKISISQAERRYRKEHAREIADIKEEFVHPEKKNFSSLESIDPKVYQGKTVVDEESGQKFRSNGKEWIPE